jgi:hypothetical protein
VEASEAQRGLKQRDAQHGGEERKIAPHERSPAATSRAIPSEGQTRMSLSP